MSSEPARTIVDAQAAAVAVQRSTPTIRRWLHEGLLTHHGYRNRRALVDLAEVYKVANAPRKRTAQTV